jgi:hypothetical protein
MTLRAVIGLVCVLAASVVDAAEERHVYRETQGDRSSLYRWTLSAAGDLYRITFASERDSFVNDCEPEGATLRWRMQSERAEARAHREGGTVVLSGRREGEPLAQRIEIGDEPWYQALSFSLGRFARSGREATSFWTLRPDTFAAVRLKAERAGREPIATADGPVLAEKVRISTTGLLSGLWQAHYWFDAKAGLFLRYEGVNGLPGTPKTVIELARPETALAVGHVRSSAVKPGTNN